ncbi:MAG: AAA family ATPase, partial [Candidatus Thiodiazotropha endolucinida]
MSDSNRKTAGKLLRSLLMEWEKAIIGKPDTLRLVMISLLCRGHLLLEDLPGLGKTTLAKALAKSLDLTFKRIQCTPDLLPADITGITIFDQKAQGFRFLPGPVFTNILLTDEINRTSPRTQSAPQRVISEQKSILVAIVTKPWRDILSARVYIVY